MSLHNETQSSPKKRRLDPFSSPNPKPIKRQHLSTQQSHRHNTRPGTNELKTRIRDIKRLLNKKTDDLPADIRVAKERELAECQRDLDKAELKKLRSKMIQKYHFVRFLERKRASKELKRLEAQRQKLENDNNLDAYTREKGLKSLNKRIKTTEIDLNYTLYSPLTQKYISLYPTERRKQQQQQQPPEPEESNVIYTESGEKPPLWYAVKQSMVDGTLELLRDGKLGVGLSGEKQTHPKDGADTMSLLVRSKQKQPELKPKWNGGDDVRRRKSSGKSGHAGWESRNGREAKEDDSESDGGFFE
ncbi:18S rRNA maturation protein [Emydomyces testavorans]|uniref:rRNA-processing protein EFG1 n=1 Tax=Emydomyces testavorans TaxID=2070801 RepID=A0AAF0DCL1_9EURO|nr:18S rRNA maturation protein [Emydomyces testavorans]